MQEDLITFETAKLAKEKEFNILCEHSFSTHDSGIQENNQNGFKNWNKEYKNSYSRPTQSLLQKWLREVHKIDVLVFHHFLQEDNTGVEYDICVTTSINNVDSEDYGNYCFDITFKIYEEAFELGLQEALKLIPSI